MIGLKRSLAALSTVSADSRGRRTIGLGLSGEETSHELLASRDAGNSQAGCRSLRLTGDWQPPRRLADCYPPR